VLVLVLDLLRQGKEIDDEGDHDDDDDRRTRTMRG
jgi:hypothetical protein